MSDNVQSDRVAGFILYCLGIIFAAYLLDRSRYFDDLVSLLSIEAYKSHTKLKALAEAVAVEKLKDETKETEEIMSKSNLSYPDSHDDSAKQKVSRNLHARNIVVTSGRINEAGYYINPEFEKDDVVVALTNASVYASELSRSAKKTIEMTTMKIATALYIEGKNYGEDGHGDGDGDGDCDNSDINQKEVNLESAEIDNADVDSKLISLQEKPDTSYQTPPTKNYFSLSLFHSFACFKRIFFDKDECFPDTSFKSILIDSNINYFGIPDVLFPGGRMFGGLIHSNPGLMEDFLFYLFNNHSVLGMFMSTRGNPFSR